MSMDEQAAEQCQSLTICPRCVQPISDLDCFWKPASNQQYWVHSRCVRGDVEFCLRPSEILERWQEQAEAACEAHLRESPQDDGPCLTASLRSQHGELIEAAHLDIEAEIRPTGDLFVEVGEPVRRVADELRLRLITRGTWTALRDLACKERGAEAKQAQVEKNYRAFKERHESGLLTDHRGRFALMRDCDVVEIFDRMHDAWQRGCVDYGIDGFSVQEIGAEPVRMPTSVAWRPVSDSA